MGSLATSKDLSHFDKKGVIVPKVTFGEFQLFAQCSGLFNTKYERYHSNRPQSKSLDRTLLWDKDVVFIPRKINHLFYFLHWIKPDIQIVSVASMKELTKSFWQEYLLLFDKIILMCPKHAHKISYIGAGAPPIETKDGWLLIYHGVCDSTDGYVYCSCAALLDLENPSLEIVHLPYPLT